MKILFINYEFPPIGGGGGTTSKYLAKEMAKSGHEIKVLTAGFANLPYTENIDGYEIIRVKCQRKFESQSTQREMLSFLLNAFRPMLKIIDDWQPDLIQIFFALPTGPLGWIVKKIKGVPYIIYLLGADVPGFLANEMDWEHRLLKGCSKQIWKNASGVVANSQGLAKLGNMAFPDVPIKVITNGVDLVDFNKISEKKEQNFFSILFVGRLVSQKGLIVSLSALNVLVNKYNKKNIRLVVVGEGADKEVAEEYIRRNSLENNVEFMGWLKLKELKRVYSSSDIFLLSSTFEGMPSVVLQAMSCGLPVISTRVFGSEDLVKDGENGYLVDVGDYKSIAEKIIKLYDDKNLMIKMGDKNLLFIRDYSWEKIAAEFINFYKKKVNKLK